ncbi:MAG: hypothetical protein ABIG95_06725 [Candidatus Woesearchaeota archaeon]
MIDIVLIVAGVLLGLITSYEDIKEHLIKNKWVFAAVIVACVSIFCRSILSWDGQYFLVFFTNILLALVLGVLVWELGFWNPGDAKLFVAFAALTPLSVYTLGYIDYFPAFTILINALTPAFFVFTVGMLFRAGNEARVRVFKQVVSSAGELAVFVFGFAWIIPLLFSLVNVEVSIVVTVLSLLVIMLVNRKAGWFDWRFNIIVAILRLFNQTEFAVMEFLLMLLFILGIRYLTELADACMSTNMPASALKPRMFVEHKNRVKKLKLIDVWQLRNGGESVKVLQTMSFAPLLFLGFLLTVLFRGNALLALKLLLERFI